MPTEQWKGKSGLNPYADFVMQIDHRVGRLNELLDELGISKNTIVIFTSDNGCSPQAKFDELEKKGHDPSGLFRGHKADIFEGGHRVPFIVKWPKKIQAASISHKTICTTDLLATCADILGKTLKDDEGEDSFSILPLLSEETKINTKEILPYTIPLMGVLPSEKGILSLFSVLDRGLEFSKAIEKETQGLPKFQLYNLREDPGEMKNLFGQHPKIELELINLFKEAIQKGRTTKGVSQKNFNYHFSSVKWEPLAVFENE